jgi:sulfoxide reductase catalytic subunit YedY
MLIKKPDDIKPSEITDQERYINRRQFIQGTGLVGLAGVASLPWLKHSWAEESTANGSGLSYRNLPRGAHSTDEELTDFDDATSYCNFYEFGTAKEDPAENAGSLVTRPWSVTVAGECNKPGQYTLEDFLKPHALEERIYRLRCVEAWSMVIPWVGFSLGDALKRFEPSSQARYVSFTTLHDPKQMPGQRRAVLDWPYREGLRIDEAMNPLATLAVGMYG